MNDLVKWTAQTSAEEMDAQTKKILARADCDWEMAREMVRVAKVYQKLAEFHEMKDRQKAGKRIELRSKRKLGELLKAMPKAKGARKPGTKRGTTRLPRVTASEISYRRLGLTKKTAFLLLKLVKVDKRVFNQIIEKTPTAAAIYKAVDEAEAAKAPASVATSVPPPEVDVDTSDSAGPSIETLKNLIQLIQELKVSEKTMLLYMYYCVYGDTSPTQADIHGYTGLSLPTIRTHSEILEILGGIKRIPPKKGQGRCTRVSVFPVNTPTPSSLLLILDILDIPSQKNMASITSGHGSLDSSNTRDSRKKKTSGSVVDDFTKEDVAGDEHWKKVKAAFVAAGFDPGEINPGELGVKPGDDEDKKRKKKKKWDTVVGLAQDKSFNLSVWAKWCYEYLADEPKLRFSFGLLLEDTAWGRFKRDSKSNHYLVTSPDQMSERQKQDIKKTHEFAKTLPKKYRKDKRRK